MSITYDIGHGTQAPALAKPRDGRVPSTHAAPARAGRTAEEPAFGAYAPSPLLARLVELTSRRSSGWLGRRTACLLRRHGARLLSTPVDMTVLGVRMRLHPADNACEKRLLFTPQYVDPAERALLAQSLSGDFTFLDIGANAGVYALAAARQAGPGARILAVEPHPELARRLSFNAACNGFGAIEVAGCALADIDGEITLFVEPDDLGRSNVKFISMDRGSGGSLRVPSRSLLTLIREHRIQRLDALKLDASGAEDLILPVFLRQAPRQLWPRLVLLGSETVRWHEDVRGLLVESGYREVLRSRANFAFELADR